MAQKRIEDITIDYYQDINLIAESWDKQLPENHHLKSSFLLPVQTSTSIKPFYIFAKKGDDVVGVVYCQLVGFAEKDVNFDNISSKKGRLGMKTFFTLTCDINFLICGNMFRNCFQGYYFKDASIDIFSFLKKFTEEAKDICNPTGIIIKETETALEESKINDNEYFSLGNDATMAYSLPDSLQSISDYEGLLSKKYRKRFQKIRASATSLKLKVFNEDDLIKNQNLIFQLYEQTLENQTIKIGRLLPSYFLNTKIALQESFQFIGIYNNDELIAFTSYLYLPYINALDIHYVGINYEFNEQYNLYFNILYWGLEEAIQKNIKHLRLGRTAETAKASLGALPMKQHNYVYLKNPTLRMSFKALRGLFLSTENNDKVIRNPFKG